MFVCKKDTHKEEVTAVKSEDISERRKEGLRPKIYWGLVVRTAGDELGLWVGLLHPSIIMCFSHLCMLRFTKK